MAGGPCRPRPASKIITPNKGKWCLGDELWKRVRTSSGGSFCVGGLRRGIEALAKPIFVRGYAPSMEVCSAPARTALAPAGYACEASERAFGLFSRVCQIRSTRRFACAPFLAPKALRQIGETGVWGNELRKCIRTSHGRFVLCWERGGDRRIGGANLRKGAALQWMAHLAPGWHASCPP